MSRRLSRGLASTAAVAGLLLSPALAGAASAAPSTSSGSVANVQPAACAPEACWNKGGTFWFKKNCQKDGRDAVRMSAKWTAYTCKKNVGTMKWHLYLKPRY